MSTNQPVQGAPESQNNSIQIDYYQEYLNTHSYINDDIAKIDAAIHQLDIDHNNDPRGSAARASYNQERADLVALSQQLRGLETTSNLFEIYSKGLSGAISGADFEAAISSIKEKADQLAGNSSNLNASQITRDVEQGDSDLISLIQNQTAYQNTLTDLENQITTWRAELDTLKDQVDLLSDPTQAAQDLQKAENQLSLLIALKDKLTSDLSALSSACAQGQDLVDELNLIGQVSDPTSDDLQAANALLAQIKELSLISVTLAQDVPSQAAIDLMNRLVETTTQDLISPNVKIIQDAVSQATTISNNLNIAQLEDQISSLISLLADLAAQLESLESQVAAHPENTAASSDLQIAQELLADLQAAQAKCQEDLDTLEQNISRIAEIIAELTTLSNLLDPTSTDALQATALLTELKKLQAVKDLFNIDAPSQSALDELKKDINTVNNDLNPVSSNAPKIENAAWYIDWTSFGNQIVPGDNNTDNWRFPVPDGVDTVNVFVGRINEQGGIDGFGDFTDVKLQAFVQSCHDQEVKVKISLGGGGGSYDNCWDNLKPGKVGTQACAQGLTDFCKQFNLDGVDFDFEEWGQGANQAPLENLVGVLIKEFKQLNPTLEATLCTNAGTSWQADMKNILDSSKDDSGKTTVDRLYIMSYYDPIENQKGWILNNDNSWAKWLETNYGFTPAQITVGIDDTDVHAYDIAEFAQWAKDQGFSTGYWEWNPATESSSNNSTNTIWDIYHQDQPSKTYQKFLNKA